MGVCIDEKYLELVSRPCDLINLIFSYNFFELVHKAPPSPVVKILFPAKLKIEMSPKVPIFLPLMKDPIDSEASSMR